MNNTIKLRTPTTEEWDRMIDITGEDNTITHWKDMLSWVHDEKFEKAHPSSRARRGYFSARFWYYDFATFQRALLGFRPTFDNLSSDGIKNGDIIPVGTLYMNGKPVKVPQNPVWNGDIEDYIPGATLSFGSALDDPDYVVTAIKVNNVFIADRVLLKNISYENITKACKPVQTGSQTNRNNNKLAGDYALLTGYASLTDEEYEETADTDETPVAVIAVEGPYLASYVEMQTDYKDIADFLANYTYDDIIGLQEAAEEDRALAFAYRPALDEAFYFPDDLRGNAMLAFADFVSGKLQENGHEDASKYLDALLDL